jgi:hypothetical protein
MASAPYAAAAALEASPLGAAMRESVFLYPAANVAHLFGLVLLVGAIGVLDLRVLGLGRAIPMRYLARLLTPLAVAGLLIQVFSGFLLFAADAGPLVRSAVFQLKVALIMVAVVNALAFRWAFGDMRAEAAPLRARVMAGLSIILWLGVAALGRLIAYF